MKLKSLFIGMSAVLLLGVGSAWSVGATKWAWDLAPKVSGYVPNSKDVNFYYPLPEVVEITSPYGYRTHPIYGDRRLHSGADLGAPEGMPVLSAHSGYVRYADWGDGYGNMVIVEYADGKYQTLYAHLSEILVREGEAVRPRQVIGKVGSTGGVTGPHLHFELLQRSGGDFESIDPTAQVKSVESYVAVRPPDSTQGSTESQVAAKSSDSKSPTWQAPALGDSGSSAPPIAASNANKESPSPTPQNGTLSFDPLVLNHN